MSTEATLATTGIHCRSCTMLIDMTVDELDGVQSVETDLESGRTKVVYDETAVSIEDIVGAIRGAGYDAEPVA